MEPEPSESRPRRWTLLIPLVLAACALIVIWLAFDLGRFRSLDQVQQTAESVRHEPRAGTYVVAAFAILTPLFVPVTALVVATVLTFGQLPGFVYALCGICAGACTTYWSGRLIGAEALLAFSGPSLIRATRALQTHAFWASLLSRMAPVGNFTVMNMLAGSMRVPFVPFLVGSGLGAAPGTLLIALFAEQAREWLRGSTDNPGPKLAVALVVLAVVVLVARKLRSKRPAA